MSDRRRILLVEDEPGLVITLRDRLEEEHFRVDHASNGEEGLEKAASGNYDIILLDWMLPKMNGIDVCKELRSKNVHTPIIMLTAKSQVIDKVLGLKLGANDYLTKPFEMMELVARIEVQLRVRTNVGQKLDVAGAQFDDVQINFKKGEITKSDQQVNLSAKEFHLLQFMVQNEGIILTRDQLLNEVWGYDALPSTRTVDVHIAWLRQKLETDSRYPKHILTVHGRGYKFVM